MCCAPDAWFIASIWHLSQQSPPMQAFEDPAECLAVLQYMQRRAKVKLRKHLCVWHNVFQMGPALPLQCLRTTPAPRRGSAG